MKTQLVKNLLVAALFSGTSFAIKAADQPATAPAEQLIGNWNFDADSATKALDSNGNKNDGTIIGTAAYKQGIKGKAMVFDGKTNYVHVSTRNQSWHQNSGQVTLMGWFYREAGAESATGLDRTQSYRLTASDSGTGAAKYSLWFQDKNRKSYVINSPKPIPDNEWHHVSGTYDGKTMKLYVDGVLVASKDISFKIQNNNAQFEIGRRDGVRFYKGMIDEVKVYDTALSADKIAKLAQKPQQ